MILSSNASSEANETASDAVSNPHAEPSYKFQISHSFDVIDAGLVVIPCHQAKPSAMLEETMTKLRLNVRLCL